MKFAFVPLLLLLVGASVAEGATSSAKISDPAQFCGAISDAIARQDVDKAVAIILANESAIDEKKKNGANEFAQKLTGVVQGIANGGGVKYFNVIGERKLGVSIYVEYFYYVIGGNDAFFVCRIHNIGSGWIFRSLQISTDFSNIHFQ